ncbi:MAG: alanine--tRNA ligase, partial [Rhodothermaceae bacterium]|nr:alanine--tRNA ligase [Rhodothermaceae bacterium]
MSPDDLRQKWFAFFEERGHVRKASASLVPENDPTLLFTGAGMNQFKAEFVGKGDMSQRRVSTIQRCFRQGDLENVGRTPRHLTFFEMMGHFSFGDYFKKEAITWAWEFLTEVVELPKDKLWVTVFEDDDEAFD